MRRVLFSLLMMFSSLALGSQQDSVVDSLLDLSIDKIETQPLDSSLILLNIISAQIEDWDQESNAKLLFNKGYAFDYHGALDTALIYYDLAEEIYRNLGDVESVANCINYKAGACFFAGDFDQAMEIYLRCLEYTELHNLDETRLKALINLGVVYRVNDKIDQAIEIYKETLKFSKSINDANMIGASYHNIGVAYSFDSSTSQALVYLDSALSQYTLLNDTLELGRTSNAIGDAYYMQGKNMSLAKEYLLKGEQYLKHYNQDEILSNTYLTLGKLEQDLDNLNQSKAYFEKGIDLLKDTDRSEQQKDFYLAYQSLLYELGAYRESYDYLNKYIVIHEELGTQERVRTIEELQAKYELEKKENQIELLNTQSEIQNTKLSARRNQLRIFGLAGLLLLSLLLIVYRLYRQLKSKNETISQALNDKDVLMREVHHRVKNNLQMVSGLLNLQTDYVEDDNALSALQDSEVRVQSIALLHQDLYSNENLRDVNSYNYLGKLIENLEETYDAVGQGIKINSKIETLYIDVESMIPIGLIVNELVTNSLKHAFKDKQRGRIDIAFYKEADDLILIVKDNGHATKDKEFNQSSFGYNLIESFALRLDASVCISSDDGFEVMLRIRRFTQP